MGKAASGRGVEHAQAPWVKDYLAMLEHPQMRTWSYQTCADTLTNKGFIVSSTTLKMFVKKYCEQVSVTPKPAMTRVCMDRRCVPACPKRAAQRSSASVLVSVLV